MTDSEYTDSDNESEYDVDISNTIYEPEEESLTRFNISLCELYNKNVHGNVNSEVLYHYLVFFRYKNLNVEHIKETIELINSEYLNLPNKSHDIFRNYSEIIRNEKYIKPEIIECIYLDTGHCIAIKKTFLIRIIQRSWRNILKKREQIIKIRGHPNSLRQREITGKWPESCRIYPSIKGMLIK